MFDKVLDTPLRDLLKDCCFKRVYHYRDYHFVVFLIYETEMMVDSIIFMFHPFAPNALFLFPPKTSENRNVL